MLTVIIGLIVLVAVVLILVVLAQNSKGGGLSNQFGGAGASQVMGVKKTGDFLEKLTWGCAIALMALTLSTKFAIDTSDGEILSPNIESATDKAVVPSLDIPTDATGDDSGLDALNEDASDSL